MRHVTILTIRILVSSFLRKLKRTLKRKISFACLLFKTGRIVCLRQKQNLFKWFFDGSSLRRRRRRRNFNKQISDCCIICPLNARATGI